MELSNATLGDLNTWVAKAEQLHPLIYQARLGVEVAILEVQKAQASHKPSVDASLSYDVTRNANGTSTAPESTRLNAATGGLALNMPLFSGFVTEHLIEEALALKDKSIQEYESTRRNVSLAVHTAYLGLLSNTQRVKALEAAESSTQSALDGNRRGYQLGVRVNLDVLNSQSQLFKIQRDLAQARYDVLVGHLKLRQASGALTAEDLQPINAALGSSGNSRSDVSHSCSPVPRSQLPVGPNPNQISAPPPR